MRALKPCVFVSKSEIDSTLTQPAAPGKRSLEPLRTFAVEHGLPFNILEDYAVINDLEVHRDAGDLWHCLEGEAVFLYGGELVRPRARRLPDGSSDDREIQAEAIAGGTEVVLRPGDWLWIPPGQPHQHRADGVARLVIIKIPARTPVPLESVPGWVEL